MNAFMVVILTPVLWYLAWGKDAGVVGAVLAVGVAIVNGKPKTQGVLGVGQVLLFIIGASCVFAVWEALVKLGV